MTKKFQYFFQKIQNFWDFSKFSEKIQNFKIIQKVKISNSKVIILILMAQSENLDFQKKFQNFFSFFRQKY